MVGGGIPLLFAVLASAYRGDRRCHTLPLSHCTLHTVGIHRQCTHTNAHG